MNFWKSLYNKKQEKEESSTPDQTQEIKNEKESPSSDPSPEKIVAKQPLKQMQNEPAEEGKPSGQPNPDKRSIRVFVSSTFRDMMEERNMLMTHTWPQLRKFCAERHVELTEVDLRWGIAEEQSTRKETLKLCLDEIRACRPFFIGLLGERYGWIPGDDAFTADLKEEQPWVNNLHGKSVTELEILHGVLRKPKMAGRAFFYFRDPEYAQKHGTDFLPENESATEKQRLLKNLIRTTCAEKNIPLHETYPGPDALAALVLEQLKEAIEAQFPKESIPNPLDKEARDHEAFAEIRRRTYIGRPDYYETLDQHIAGEGTPLVLLGDSGSGKSALLANWINLHHNAHPKDLIFQHYIGGTSDSAIHWKLMTRLISEIKHWTNDPDEIPRTNDDILRDFALWLSKARIKAEHEGVRFVVVLDALNQLEDKDHGRLLGWLPEHPFTGALRLIVSTLPGETQEVLEQRKWQTLSIKPLTNDERKQMIVEYLKRFSKKLDDSRLDRLANSKATANPLYLKILLDELRVTGTHDKLDERLNDYLTAKDIPTLLGKVLTRYQRDYEHDREGLVKDALSMIWAARRGLTETELLQLLRPAHLSQLPLVIWAPLRAALEEGLVDRGGILNFAHDFLRQTVVTLFLQAHSHRRTAHLVLADYFAEQQEFSLFKLADQPKSLVDLFIYEGRTRKSDEWPWQLQQAEEWDLLQQALTKRELFILLFKSQMDEELTFYWARLREAKPKVKIGKLYLEVFESWEAEELSASRLGNIANLLGLFLENNACYKEAETLYRRALEINEKLYGLDHHETAIPLNNLASLLQTMNRLSEAESLMRRAIGILESYCGENNPLVATSLNNLASLLYTMNRLSEAEPLLRRALDIREQTYGQNSTHITTSLASLAQLFEDTNRLSEAESLMRRALDILEQSYGEDHPLVALSLDHLSELLYSTSRLLEAEPLMRRSLDIYDLYRLDSPNVATSLNNLAALLLVTNRISEAEPLLRKSLEILISINRTTGHQITHLPTSINNYVSILQAIGWSEDQINDQKRKMGIEF